MSLQVWLPLNGNLNNQGLNNIAFTNEGNISSDTSGKIGSCYSRATLQTSGRLVSNSKILFDNSISICCWAYVSGCVGDTANGLVSLHSHEDNSNVGITVKQVSSTDYRISCNTGTGSGRTYCTYYGTTNIKNTWNHLALTYNKDSKILKLYVNGNCEYTLNNYTNYAISDNIIVFDWSTTYNNPAYRPACKLNDVRIYDTCLSSKEIKEISKGLICHYKLNGKGFGNPNLINTNSPLKAGGRTVVTDKKLIISAIDTTADTYFTINLAEAIQADVEYTLSCDVEDMNCNTNWNFPLFAQGNPISKTLVISPNTSKASITFTVPTGSSYVGTTTIFMDDAGRPSTNPNNITLSNFKLERGSVATQWCPHTSDTFYTSLGLNSTTESDNSGYKYDGTLSEPLSLVSGSPRYGECYYFNSTSKRITLPTINMTGFANSFSVSWWGKAPSYSSLMYWGFSNGNRLNYYEGKYCNTGDGSSNPYYIPNTTTTITAPSVNVWHHFVMVGDGTSNKLYMDGALYGVAKAYKGITGSSIVINGWDSSTSYKTNGYISDFRIYATALSADDVKELYNTSASVDKNGNMYAYEFKEE